MNEITLINIGFGIILFVFAGIFTWLALEGRRLRRYRVEANAILEYNRLLEEEAEIDEKLMESTRQTLTDLVEEEWAESTKSPSSEETSTEERF